MNLHTCCTLLFGILLTACVTAVPAQTTEDPRTAETRPRVPALEKFHTPIFKLWHTAWPQKDTAMMAALTPEVEAGVAEIAAAGLPGILREKKAVWEENLKGLQEIAAGYRSTMAGSALQPKLDVVERLHSQYEKMVRSIRPVLKEIEDFHAVLYMLYHFYLPENKQDKIAESAGQLKQKMAGLNAAVLPERMKAKETAFAVARERLSASVDALVNVMPSGDQHAITHAATEMHARFEALENVFE